uniref:Uncharacterized protein n=1 Tax=Picocystis salinarum TaxID=88271 RepID=A0A7S3UFF4_9CHLO|mmetsp:Transcript_5740/g.35693  ORF Transcript_5740/g.35693 Transcript_5740/m.35693 type:complete len:549 (+) Transcript_5740:1286-2932(+)
MEGGSLRWCCTALRETLELEQEGEIGWILSRTDAAIARSSEEELDEVFMDMFPLLSLAVKQCSPHNNQTGHTLENITGRSNPREVLLLACAELANISVMDMGNLALSVTLMRCLCNCMERQTRGLVHSTKTALAAVVAVELAAFRAFVSNPLEPCMAKLIARTLLEGAKSISTIGLFWWKRDIKNQPNDLKEMIGMAVMVSLGTTVLPLAWSAEMECMCEPLLALLTDVLSEDGRKLTWPRDASMVERKAAQLLRNDFNLTTCVENVPHEEGELAFDQALSALKYINVVRTIGSSSNKLSCESLARLSFDLVNHAVFTGPECMVKASELLVEAASAMCFPCHDHVAVIFNVEATLLCGSPGYDHMLLFVRAWTSIAKLVAFQPKEEVRATCGKNLRESVFRLDVEVSFFILRLVFRSLQSLHPASVTLVMSILHQQVVRYYPCTPFHFDAVLGLIGKWIRPTDDTWTGIDDLVMCSAPVCAAVNTLYFMVMKAKGTRLYCYSAEEARSSILPLKEVLDTNAGQSAQSLGPLCLVVSDILFTVADALKQ